MAKLKPCPFCGGEVELLDFTDRVYGFWTMKLSARIVVFAYKARQRQKQYFLTMEYALSEIKKQRERQNANCSQRGIDLPPMLWKWYVAMNAQCQEKQKTKNIYSVCNSEIQLIDKHFAVTEKGR